MGAKEQTYPVTVFYIGNWQVYGIQTIIIIKPDEMERYKPSLIFKDYEHARRAVRIKADQRVKLINNGIKRIKELIKTL